MLRQLNITDEQIKCVNNLISNLRISRIIITPYILAEFLGRIKREFKQDYKEIKKCFMKDLRAFNEINFDKNLLLEHRSFYSFGNDVSLVLATEKQIKDFNYSSIMSFDGRFIKEHFKDEDKTTLVFDLDTLQYFYLD